VRVDLAAAYRLAALERWDDLIYTHISATVPGEPDHFLINPFGFAFDEIRASISSRSTAEARWSAKPSIPST
jgi:ribulose-5-phosphate 4-epimerase/fuculose-1-phosphate aldolase